MANKKKGSRKIDRNRDFCKYYKIGRIRERNKIVRLDRHLKKFPGDTCALEARKLAKASV